MTQPICLFCGRDASQIDLVRAELLAQPGIWACVDHVRTDGWHNWPHGQAPFDIGYPNAPVIVPISVDNAVQRLPSAP